MQPRCLQLALVGMLALLACQDPPGSAAVFQVGDFVVTVTGRSLAVARADGSVLLESEAPPAGSDPPPLPSPLGWRRSSVDIRTVFGMFMFLESPSPWIRPEDLVVVAHDQDRLELRAGAALGVLEAAGAGMLRVTWSLREGAGANRLIQSFRCTSDDRFFGLGARVHGTEHRGEVIPAWVSEQGIGKLRRTNPYEGFPLQGDIHDTYLPVPFLLSGRGFGLLVEDSRRSLFHLCPATSEEQWAVEIWNDRLRYLVVDGPEPSRILERLTAETGRPRLPPKWAFGPWIDAVHGQSQVLQAAQLLRQEGVPASAIWTEDWIGGGAKLGGYHLNYHWEVDTTFYPDLKQLSSQLRASGLRLLGYFNPFIEKGYDEHTEALQYGHVIKGQDGKPLDFVGPLMQKSTMPDLSRPETVAWLQGYLERAEALGLHGWMADYGEWLPVEARLADGTPGMEAHNLYPLLWQQAHRQFWDKRRPDGDYVFFVRSGWAGTGGLAPVVWAGDQQTEFGGLDGMASVIPLCVNAGMSGIPIMTHDIAGYSTIGEGVVPTTRELFFRWTELGAFSSVMRTHHGAMADENWQWNHDAETIAHFRRYARIHVALFPYRYSIARSAAARGLPMMRHLALHHAADLRALRIADQFLLGPYLLVAPVVEPGATARKVYLPAGARTWYDYWKGTAYAGGTEQTVAAPLEEIPLFAPSGAIVPAFLEAVDTLDRAQDSTLRDIDDAEAGGLALRVFLGADGAFTLYEGSRFALTCPRRPTGAVTVEVDGKAWPACSGDTTVECVRQSGGRIELTIDGAPSFDLRGGSQGGESFRLRVTGAGKPRRYEVTFLW